MSFILEFFKCLPELLALYKLVRADVEKGNAALAAAETEDQIQRKTKTDLQKIHEAYATKDPSILNATFRSQ